MNAMTVIQPNVPAFSMAEVEKIATAIARGGLFGSKDPFAVLTLCMMAQAEGQHPAVAFRDYHIISGKPAKKAEAMQRDFLTAGGKIEWHQLDDDCADATFSHPQGGTTRISWDKARVKQAQLGSNTMHTKYPRQMLRARVISEGVKTVYPGATSGLYTPEEVQSFDDAPARPAMPQPQRARDMKQIAAPVDDEASFTDAPPAITGTTGADAGAAPMEVIESARNWVDETLRDISACKAVSDLAALQHAKAKGMARLATFPKLHGDVKASFDDKLAALEAQPVEDGAPF